MSEHPQRLSTTPTLRILDAAESGDIGLLSALLRLDATLANVSGEYAKTPLHWAAEKNHVEIAKLLLESGADPALETSWGATALEWAGYVGSRGVAELLLERGATGMNLVLAAGLGNLDLVRDFCEQNESLDGLGIPRRETDAQDEKGWPPEAARMKGDVLGESFQVACRNGHTEVARYLLDRGADLGAMGYFGGTALHWAAAHGHRDTVEFLLEQGADTQSRDTAFDESPFGWAAEGGHDDIAVLIRDHGDGGLSLKIEH